MTKGKKIVAVAVCLAVVAGGTVGGTVIYRTQQTKKNRVDVLPVANLTQYWWGDDLSMDGQVVSGDVQNVTPSDDQMIAKVLVKEGDHVTVTEGVLPSNYYYTIDPSLAMSGNYPFRERLLAREGDVTSVVENPRGFYVTVAFSE